MTAAEDTTGHLARAVREAPSLRGVPADEVRRLVRDARELLVPAGEVVIEAGTAPEAVYLVVNGLLRVIGDDGEVRAEIPAGQLAGEMAVLGASTRSASVVAGRDTHLVRFPAPAFARATAGSRALKQLSASAITRLGFAGRSPSLAGRTASVAVITLDPAPGLSLLNRRLVRRLESWGRVGRVTSAAVDRALGDGLAQLEATDPGQGALVAWLDQVHAANDLVVYQADATGGLSPWVLRCARQADRVVVVARAEAPPSADVLSRVGRIRQASQGPVELVLVRRPEAAAHAAPWLELAGIGNHHWVRIGDEADLHRLARVIARRSVGLVLSGGGAKGMAHLGVIRALEEAGIPIDAAGGTSIGAVMAGALAAEWDAPTRIDKTVANFLETRFLIGVTLPVVALSSGRRLTGLLRHPENFGERLIEDLALPFYCVSTNLSRGGPVIHRRGPLWWAIRASISIPGVLPPVWSEGDLLADGGIVDDVPVDVMARGIADHVVAVDLQPTGIEMRAAEFSPMASGWRLLADRVRHRNRQRPPSALKVMGRATAVGMAHSQRAARAHCRPDLWFEPPTGSVRPLDFKSAVSLIEPAYRYASELLESHPAVSSLTS